MNDSAKIEIFTDGECPLCKWMRARVEPFDTRNRLGWLNFRDPEVLEMAAPRTFEELNSEMHAHMPDGRWLKGYPAWLEVLRVLPKWRWVTPLLSLPGIASLGGVLYRWLADRRFTLFGVPPPCSPDGVCALHKNPHRRKV